MKEPFCSITKVKNLRGKRVLLRASLNVPTKDGVIVNDFRIKKALETIQYLQKQGAKTIILAHIGRDPKQTLRPVYVELRKVIDLSFVDEVVGEKASKAIDGMKEGEIVMLENTRQHLGETANDFTFAETLCSYADLYVNDAFSSSHREHASLLGPPKFLPSYAGQSFVKEYEALSHAHSPEHPALFILGGAKFATKQPLVEKFLSVYDHVFVGGALSNDFYKAKGFTVGKSLLSETPLDLKRLLDHKRIVIPEDVTVLTADGRHVVKKPNELSDTDMINDCGPMTLKTLEKLIAQSKFVLWNGPLGDYQLGFSENTEELAKLIIKSGVESVVGGGDTTSLLATFELENSFSFTSTAGGAMLQFLLSGTLPALEALEHCSKQ